MNTPLIGRPIFEGYPVPLLEDWVMFTYQDAGQPKVERGICIGHTTFATYSLQCIVTVQTEDGKRHYARLTNILEVAARSSVYVVTETDSDCNTTVRVVLRFYADVSEYLDKWSSVQELQNITHEKASVLPLNYQGVVETLGGTHRREEDGEFLERYHELSVTRINIR